MSIVDFASNKLKASRTAIAWPDKDYALRRASVNSFGYGGSNAHAIIDQPSVDARSHYVSSYKAADEEGDDDFDDGEEERPYTLVISGNDATSLKANIQALCNHLINPRVKVNLSDLAYTLHERRTRLWHRAFITTRTTDLDENDFIVGKNSSQQSRIGFVFTGQGAQWPQMAKDMLTYFPWTRSILEELDQVLAAQPNPPAWSLIKELTESRTADHLRQPEFSQPLVTALQLCIVAVLESWGVKPRSVMGHSSGEIAAAYTAGLLDRAGAIKAAFYRGRAALNRRNEAESNGGMLAVGLGASDATPFIEKYAGDVWIACFNSPSSVTISGRKPALDALAEDVKAAGHFARLLLVDLAYHSQLMDIIGEEYHNLLTADEKFQALSGSSDVTMFSSVTGSKKDTLADSTYWKTNMVSPVRFSDALQELIAKDSPTTLIEIGPSGALAGPISQVLKTLSNGSSIPYCASWARGANAGKALFDTAGRLFITGVPIDMSLVNQYNTGTARTIIDLPNYCWNHKVKYWHENAASKDWRFKKFITHDLLGSKIPGISWEASPVWRKHLYLNDVPWLRDHKMGPDVLVPGAGLATIALEAMYQKYCALNPDEALSSPNELAYRFRNVKFDRAVVVEENKPTTIMLTLSKVHGSKDWHEFRIQTKADDVIYDHCSGLIRVQDPIGDDEALSGAELAPLKHPQSARLWYKAQREVGMGFGPSFQKIKSIESVSGSRKCRAIVSLEPPESKWEPESYYPLHPAVFDSCLQGATPANAAGERSLVNDTMIPALVDDLVVNKMPKKLHEGLAVAESVYTGRGRRDVAKSWTANIAIHDPETGALLMRVNGLNYIRLDVDEKPDPHSLQCVTWKPDISLLTQDQLAYLPSFDNGSTRLDTMVDLIAHKKPGLKVVEVNLDDGDASSLWFEGNEVAARAAYAQYDFATSDAKTLVTVQGLYESRRNAAFHLMTPGEYGLGLLGTESTYDLAIVKTPSLGNLIIEEVLKNLKPLLESNAFTILVRHDDGFTTKLANLASPSNGEVRPPSPEGSSITSLSDDTPPTSVDTPSEARSSEHDLFDRKKLQSLSNGDSIFKSVKNIPATLGNQSACLLDRTAVGTDSADRARHLYCAQFDEAIPSFPGSLQARLETSGWTISTAPVNKLAQETKLKTKSAVLVLDELSKPVLTQIPEKQWEALKQLISTGTPILWVTKGASTNSVNNPENAMAQGLFRVVRRENPDARCTVLDVQSATSLATEWAIEQVLQKIQIGTDIETEYAERDGVLLIQRVIPDIPVNDFKAAEGGKGLEPVVKGLHQNEAQVRIQAEKVGTLQSLTWCETDVGEVPVEPGMVEIEVMAVGVNFKVRKSPRRGSSTKVR